MLWVFISPSTHSSPPPPPTHTTLSPKLTLGTTNCTSRARAERRWLTFCLPRTQYLQSVNVCVCNCELRIHRRVGSRDGSADIPVLFLNLPPGGTVKQLEEPFA
jgi:hypothetical protein